MMFTEEDITDDQVPPSAASPAPQSSVIHFTNDDIVEPKPASTSVHFSEEDIEKQPAQTRVNKAVQDPTKSLFVTPMDDDRYRVSTRDNQIHATFSSAQSARDAISHYAQSKDLVGAAKQFGGEVDTLEPSAPATVATKRPTWQEMRAAARPAGARQDDGLVTPGNLDPFHRPDLKYPEDDDGSTSSISFTRDGKEILIPTSFEDTPGAGSRRHSVAASIKHYDQTGQHLGIFSSPEAADRYATALDAEQQRRSAASDATEPATTPPTLPAPVVPVNVGGRGTGLDVRKSDASILAVPFEGVGQAARGAVGLAGDINEMSKLNPGLEGTYQPPTKEQWDHAKASTSDVLEGGFKALAPMAAAGVVAAPVASLIALGVATGADKAARDAVKAMGGSEEDQRLAGNVAAALAAGVGTDLIIKQAKAGMAALGERGRAARERPAPGAARMTPDPSDIVLTPDRTQIPERAEQNPISGTPATPTAPNIGDDVTTLMGASTAPAAPVESARPPMVQSPTVVPGTAAPVPGPPGGDSTVSAPPVRGLLPGEEAGLSQLEDLQSTIHGEDVPTKGNGTYRPDAPAAVVDVSPPKDQREEHSFSSTQVNLPPDTAKKVLDLANAIPDKDLAEDGRAGDTDATAPHVTLKYGLHTTDVEKVRKVLADEPPVTVTLGKTSYFPNGESGSGDVLKVDVDSPDLHRLNAKVADALEHTDTHPDYTPHVTIAYLKPGLGKRYEGDDSLQGHTVTMDAVRFSTKDGKIFEISLAGAAGPNSKAQTPTSTVDVLDTGEAQPRLPGDAGAVRDHHVATPQIEAPFSLSGGTVERPTGRQGGLLDTPSGEAQTSSRESVEQGAHPEPGAEGGAPNGGVPPSYQGSARESVRQREVRRVAHYNEVFPHVLAAAQTVDPSVDPVHLRTEFDDRVNFLEDQHREFQHSGRDPRELLRAIAKNGGLAPESKGGLTGELRTLMEGNRGGAAGGVANVFRSKRQLDDRGAPVKGLPFDVMVQRLQEDPRFSWVENTDMLIDAIDDAIRHPAAAHTFPGTAEIAHALGMDHGRVWWREKEPADAGPGESSEVGLEGADASFNPDELEMAAPPPAITARRYRLTGEAADVQARAATALEHDVEGFVDRYRARFGTVLNADNASELFTEYAESPATRARLVRAVRGPAGSLVDEVYRRALTEPVPRGKEKAVVFSSGGNGAGKSTVAQEAEPAAAIVFDSTLSLEAPSKEKIDQALKAGFKVLVAHVSRDPVASLVHGTLPRAMDAAAGNGRTVDLSAHARTHLEAPKVFLALERAYRDNPAVAFRAYQSVEGHERPTTLRLNALRVREYPERDVLLGRLHDALDAEHAAGRISDAVYEGTRGTAVEAGSGGSPRADDAQRGGQNPAAEEKVRPTARRRGAGESEHEMAVLEKATAPAKAAARAVAEAGADIRSTLTAPTVTEAARLSSRSFRRRIAQMVHTVAYASHALQTYRNAVEGLTVDHAAILDLADALEDPTGTGKQLPDALKPWATIRNQVFDYLKQQIADLGLEKEWKEHYLGHVWEKEFKDEKASPSVLAKLIGRRPLQGPKTFLKQRTIPTMREGVEKFGKEPTTWNLVDIDLYKMEEMAKFVLGRQALEDNKRMGTWQFVTALKKAPEGMVAIPDPIGEVWAPPEITVHEAYDKLLMEGLESFIHSLGVKYARTTSDNGTKWGSSGSTTGNIKAKFGGPEGVLMHEIGHTLDLQYGLYDRIAGELKTAEFPGDKSALKELRALAELRHEGSTPTGPAGEKFTKYIQRREEQIANLVHAYLYAPEKAKAVAPRAYDALDSLILETPELEPLADLQQMRSLVLGVREANHKLPGPMLLGRYYAPPEVARIFKNYLTPGLNANRAWALVRIPANAVVQAKLALSAFHAFTITQESAAMEAARGIADVFNGRPRMGAKRLARALVEPVAVVARGRAARREYLSTLDPMSLAVDSATNLLLAGGGRVEQSREYSNHAMRKFSDALRRANAAYARKMHGRAGSEALLGGMHALPALVEAVSYPIMQMLVPAAKAASTVSQIRSQLEALPGEATEATLLAIASKAVNLSDAALGEVVWDNYFLPRALMSAVHMVIMAPGWRGGTGIVLGRGLTDPIRRLFPSQRETYTVTPRKGAGDGGGGDAGGDAGGGPRKVKEPYWSPYTSLLIASALVQVLISEIYQESHGAGHVRSAKDVAFPRTGEVNDAGTPERVRLPGMVGIFYDILRDVPSSVLEYALGGSAPMPTGLYQLYQNETAFGEEIVHKDDPWRQQLADYAEFLKEQFEPISVNSYGRRAGTATEKTESILGISPAPVRATQSAAEQKLREVEDRRGRPTLTKDQASARQARTELRRGVVDGGPDGRAQVTEAIRSRTLTSRQIQEGIRDAHLTSLQRGFKTLALDDAIGVYTLATPDERRTLFTELFTKRRAFSRASPGANETLQRFNAAVRLPRALTSQSGAMSVK